MNPRSGIDFGVNLVNLKLDGQAARTESARTGAPAIASVLMPALSEDLNNDLESTVVAQVAVR